MHDNLNIPTIAARILTLSGRSKTHNHKHHQIVFGLHGHAEFEISGNCGYIQKGVGCIVPSNFDHSFYGTDDNQILVLDISENLALFELETAFSRNALGSILDTPKYFQFDQKMQSLLGSFAKELKLLTSHKTAPSVIGQCILHSLYYRLRSEIKVEEVEEKIINRIDLPRIKRFITGNLSGKIHTSDLARLCNLSESHFYSKFKNTIGVSPYQYVIDERIKVACAMLNDSAKSITEICFSLGFSSQSAFTNVFKNKIGVSPSAYRQEKATNKS